MVNKKKTKIKKKKRLANKYTYNKGPSSNINRYNLEKDFQLETLKNFSRREEEKDIKNQFKIIDKDGSGFIDVDELNAGLKKYGIKMSIDNTKKLLNKYDNNPDSRIDVKEFVQLKRDIDDKDFRDGSKSVKINFKKIRNDRNTRKRKGKKKRKVNKTYRK